MFRNEISLLKKENRVQIEVLKENTRETVNNVMKSFSIFNINSYDKEVIRRDLIGMAQELELRDFNLEGAIGENPEEFISEIKRSSRGANKTEILFELLIKLSSIFFLSFALLSLLAYSSLTWYSNKIIFLLYGGTSLIAFTMEELIAPLYSVEKGFKRRIPTILSIILFLMLTGTVYVLNDNQNTVKIDAGLIMIVSGLAYIIFNYLKTKNIQRLSKDKKKYIEDLVKKE